MSMIGRLLVGVSLAISTAGSGVEVLATAGYLPHSVRWLIARREDRKTRQDQLKNLTPADAAVCEAIVNGEPLDRLVSEANVLSRRACKTTADDAHKELLVNFAVWNWNLKAIETLLGLGADRTVAICNGLLWHKPVEQLIQKKDLSLKCGGEPLLLMALFDKNEKVFKHLVGLGEDGSEFICGAIDNKWSVDGMVHKPDLEKNVCLDGYQTLLTWSVGSSNLAAVEHLLGLGADVNAADALDMTALSSVDCRDDSHLPILRRLLEHSVDTNAKDDEGNTRLLRASLRGEPACVELLLPLNKRESLDREWPLDTHRFRCKIECKWNDQVIAAPVTLRKVLLAYPEGSSHRQVLALFESAEK